MDKNFLNPYRSRDRLETMPNSFHIIGFPTILNTNFSVLEFTCQRAVKLSLILGVLKNEPTEDMLIVETQRKAPLIWDRVVYES